MEGPLPEVGQGNHVHPGCSNSKVPSELTDQKKPFDSSDDQIKFIDESGSGGGSLSCLSLGDSTGEEVEQLPNWVRQLPPVVYIQAVEIKGNTLLPEINLGLLRESAREALGNGVGHSAQLERSKNVREKLGNGVGHSVKVERSESKGRAGRQKYPEDEYPLFDAEKKVQPITEEDKDTSKGSSKCVVL